MRSRRRRRSAPCAARSTTLRSWRISPARGGTRRPPKRSSASSCASRRRSSRRLRCSGRSSPGATSRDLRPPPVLPQPQRPFRENSLGSKASVRPRSRKPSRGPASRLAGSLRRILARNPWSRRAHYSPVLPPGPRATRSGAAAGSGSAVASPVSLRSTSSLGSPTVELSRRRGRRPTVRRTSSISSSTSRTSRPSTTSSVLPPATRSSARSRTRSGRRRARSWARTSASSGLAGTSSRSSRPRDRAKRSSSARGSFIRASTLRAIGRAFAV